MGTQTDRTIDFEVLALNSGLFDTLPPPPPRSALEYPGRAVDFEVLSLDSGLFDTLPPPSRPLYDSLSPVVEDESIDEVPEVGPRDTVLPPLPVRRYRVAEVTGASVAIGLMALAMMLRPAGDHAAAVSAPRGEPTITVPIEIVAPRPAPVSDAIPAVVAPAPRKAIAPPRADAPQPAPAVAPAVPSIARAVPAAVPVPNDLVIAPIAALPPADRDLGPTEAARAVSRAARAAGACVDADDARTTMPVSVTFSPSGRVTAARITGGPFLSTEIGGCIARSLRGASVRPFAGAPVTVNASVRIR
ncbi:MAG: hypothetical protein QM820_48395 [Minicystis sp.]